MSISDIASLVPKQWKPILLVAVLTGLGVWGWASHSFRIMDLEKGSQTRFVHDANVDANVMSLQEGQSRIEGKIDAQNEFWGIKVKK